MYAAQPPAQWPHIYATHVTHSLIPPASMEDEPPAWFAVFEARVARRLDAIEGKVDEMMEKLGEVDGKVDEVGSNLEDVSNTVDDTESAVNELDTSSITETVDEIKTALAHTRIMAAKSWNTQAGSGIPMRYEIVPDDDGDLPTEITRPHKLPALHTAENIASLTEQQVVRYLRFYGEQSKQRLPIEAARAKLRSFIGCSETVE